MYLSPSQFEATSNLRCSLSPSVTISRWNPFLDIVSGLGQTAPIYYFWLTWFTGGMFGVSYFRARQEMEDDAAGWGGVGFVGGVGWHWQIAPLGSRFQWALNWWCCFTISGYLIRFLIFDALAFLAHSSRSRSVVVYQFQGSPMFGIFLWDVGGGWFVLFCFVFERMKMLSNPPITT